MKLLKQLTSLLALITLLSFMACAPRGESNTVDEIYQAAKLRFANSMRGKAPEGVESLSKNLEAYAKAESAVAAAGTAGQIADGLSAITEKAGYTTRPALDQLMKQFRYLSAAKKDSAVNKAALRLLAARTLHTLASELETTAFAL